MRLVSGVATPSGIRSRPSLRAMENTVDFDGIIADAVNRQKGKARKISSRVPGLRLVGHGVETG